MFDSKEKKHKDNIESLKNQIQQQKDIIVTQQKNIVNIEEAITHINSMLQEIGIDDISIQKVDEEEMYAIGRHEETEVKFKTLSEGERTIISVLYFIETCKGLINRGATRKKRIVVIDDPVSSLSTQYLFSLGRISFPSRIHFSMVPTPVSYPTGRAFSRETFRPLYSAGLCDAVI